MTIEKLQIIFKQVFENEKIVITPETSPNDISNWNSLKHVLLISEVEKQFKIQFTLDEMIEMQNVGDILACINSKLS